MKLKAAVFDIDGVLADMGHRLHHIRCDAPDFILFYDGMKWDPPNEAWVNLLRTTHYSIQVILLTRRPYRYRVETEDWLRANGIPYRALIMRSDYSQAHEFKASAIKSLRENFDISFAVDDDPEVIQAYIDLGIPAIWAYNGVYDSGRTREPMDEAKS